MCNFANGSSCKLSMFVNDFSINQKDASDGIKNLFTSSAKNLFSNKYVSEIPNIKYTFQKQIYVKPHSKFENLLSLFKEIK